MFEAVYPGEYDLVLVVGDRVLGQKLLIQDRDVVRDIDLDSHLVPVAFLRGGEIVDSIDGGSIETESVYCHLSRCPGRPGIWAANVHGGPVLAFLQDRGLPMQVDPQPPEHYVIAYSPAQNIVEGVTNVHIRGAALSIYLKKSGPILPWAYIRGVGVFKDRWQAGLGPCLAYRDVEGVRVFLDIPVGTSLTLVSPRSDSQNTWTMDISIDSTADQVIAWPPDH